MFIIGCVARAFITHALSLTDTVCDVVCDVCGMAAMCDAANKLGAEGAAVVAGALEKMPQLTSVNLGGK